ncbi:MAG TPA: outer membrane beta-barrel protein [Caulobacteraceae bacterium]|nr:outer membrane beta-barrel protein [Caulobacteraceae bacterium]
MISLKRVICAASAFVGLAWFGAAIAQTAAPPPPPAAPAAPAATPMPYPSMTAPLAANPNPATFDAGPFGKIMVDGVLSADAFWQSNPQFGPFGLTNDSYGDVTNAQVILNKTDGVIQFYVQAGAYSIPTVGVPYLRTDQLDHNTFGYVPQGFVKIVPNSTFNVMVGALPTLVGAEYAFTFENFNVERGLLWNLEPVVSKGVQLNVSKGPWSASLAWTDGYDSNVYTALSGQVTYTFKNSDTLEFVGEGNVGTNHVATFVTPLAANNGQIYDLIYTHTKGAWEIQPYLQYQSTPNIRFGGVLVVPSGTTWGAAVLTKYNFTPTFSVAGRVEYVSSSGGANLLGYGVGSNAWTITLTPTYQKGIFFVRGELSYAAVGSGTPGFMFGKTGNADNQTRALVETGVIF